MWAKKEVVGGEGGQMGDQELGLREDQLPCGQTREGVRGRAEGMAAGGGGGAKQKGCTSKPAKGNAGRAASEEVGNGVGL